MKSLILGAKFDNDSIQVTLNGPIDMMSIPVKEQLGVNGDILMIFVTAIEHCKMLAKKRDSAITVRINDKTIIDQTSQSGLKIT